jgi:gliding motility-associated-like protein
MKKFTISILISLKASLFCQTSAGVLGTASTVCQGTNSGMLSLSSYSGSIIRWEFSTSAFGPWSVMSFNSPVYTYSNLAQSTWFRAVVQLSGYSAISSNAVQVVCDSPSLAGAIVTNTSVCQNMPLTLELSGHAGSVIAWVCSNNAWITTQTITSQNLAEVTCPGFSLTTVFRCHVKNGVCPLVTTGEVTINPVPQSVGGTATANNTVCASSNQGSLSLSAHTGTILGWEASYSANGPYFPLSGTAGQTILSYSNISQTTWYRAVVKSGSCSESTSSPARITVEQPPTPPNIIGTSSLCKGTNSVALAVSNVAPPLQWQASIDQSSWTNLSSNQNLLAISNLTITTYIRASKQGFSCAAATGNSFTINLLSAPSCSFNLNPVCQLTPVQFTNQSTGSVQDQWSFGDGTSSALVSPAHTYSAHGTFSVKLRCTNSFGCTDSMTKQMTVRALPQLNVLNSDSVCYGQPVVFSCAASVSNGTISTYTIKFGDGDTVNTPQCSHLYEAGLYESTFTAKSNVGCVSTLKTPIRVFAKPLASFICPNTCLGNSSAFLNTSFAIDGPLYYSWTIGGATYTIQHPVHTFTTKGSNAAALVISTTHNCSDTAVRYVFANETPNVTINASDVCHLTAASFSAATIASSIKTNFNINFGDGSAASGDVCSHIYASPGLYKASVVAENDSGCKAFDERYIRIFPNPRAAFFVSAVCEKDSIRPQNVSYGEGQKFSFLWTSPFHTSTLDAPSFYFDKAGSYPLELTVVNENGCRDTIKSTIDINANPKAGFAFNKTCDTGAITFTNTSTFADGAEGTYSWDFGDYTNSRLKTPEKTFLLYGTYSVSLAATSSFGCRNQFDTLVKIDESPLANFTTQNVCNKDLMRFSNTSLVSSTSIDSKWKFGGESKSNEPSPSYRFTAAGIHEVILSVSTAAGCTDSISKFVEVFDNPLIETIHDTTIEKGATLTLFTSGGSDYSWFTSGIDRDLSGNAPVVRPFEEVSYTVIGTDKRGCSSADTVVVKIREDFDVEPMNLLTPNSNGLNDTWVIKNIDAYPDNEVLVYNLWNELVYQKKNYDNKWDGRNLTGELLPDGTYYFALNFSGTSQKRTGFVTLVREAGVK